MKRAVAIGAAIGAVAGTAVAGHSGFLPPAPFALEGGSPGGAAAAHGAPAYLAGSRIAAVDDGALAIDADSGVLARVDAAGASVAQLAIGRDAGLLVYDDVARVAYVADRVGDRIVVVRVGAALEIAAAWRTPAEPYGVALTPDRTTALVTCIADRLLVALDVATGQERWRLALASEPRGLAVSPDGARALIAYAGAGAIDEIALADRTALHRALPRRSDDQAARGAVAVAFLGGRLAVAPFQLDRPSADDGGATYGGSRESPISEQLALFGVGGRRRTAVADLRLPLPRALAWDAARDALYLAGPASDDIVQLVHASQVDIRAGVVGKLGGRQRCGPDGLAIAGDGSLLVWCSFTRSVARVTAVDGHGKLAASWRTTHGPALAASALTAVQHDGMVLFHSASGAVSQLGLVCASCHPDGRADGLSWRIGNRTVQTPVLAGRVVDTAPYGWDARARDLPASLRSTVNRLGGGGLGAPQIAALAAYLEAMPPVHRPTRDAAAIARGKAVFDAAGCPSCHDGPAYTDRERHQLTPAQRAIDTPSLRGLAASAPYFHDGSAATLEALLRDRGAVHGMSPSAGTLSDGELADLTAFLESL